ncbi:MAG: hypothetical protein GY851_19975 [bacterium]|nr:hypothetical protein [bacterium]
MGSAWRLEKLCGRDAPYRRLYGGVPVDYHSLADFRTAFDGMLDRCGRGPEELLADGGYVQKADIESMARPELGCTVFVPVRPPRNPENDPHEPKPGDGPGVIQWRARMATAEANELYKERSSTTEWANAQTRNRGLLRFAARGLKKVRTVALMYALAHNLVTGLRLRKLAAQAA